MDGAPLQFEKQAVPKKLVRIYFKKYKFKLKIANPNEEWNSTDMVTKKDFNSQLIFAGHSGNKGFVLVKSAGTAMTKNCIIYDLEAGFVQNIGLSWSVKTLDELKVAVSEYLGCGN